MSTMPSREEEDTIELQWLREEVSRLRDQRTKLLNLADAAGRLVAALPQCDECNRPATRAWVRGSDRFCDYHALPDGIDQTRPMPPEYPRAQPLRDTIAALKELET